MAALAANTLFSLSVVAESLAFDDHYLARNDQTFAAKSHLTFPGTACLEIGICMCNYNSVCAAHSIRTPNHDHSRARVS